MESSSLDSVLSEEVNETADTTTGQQTNQGEQVKEVTDSGDDKATGEQQTGTPPVKQEDELEKHRKGLETAAVAERRKRQEAEARAQALEARLRELEKPQQTQQQGNQQGQEQEPKRESFATDAEFIRALARHEAKQLREAEKAQEREEQQQRREKEHAAVMQQTAEEIVTKGQKQYPDFDTVINENLAPYLGGTALHSALLMSEKGHEIAYYLGKNPGEADRVARLSPMAIVRELALIEATKLTAAPEQRQEQQLPETLTQSRDARGRFDKTTYDGPTPLDDILSAKK